MPVYEIVQMADFYLLEEGDRWIFRKQMENPHYTLGQAFFNALSYEDKLKIRGTAIDPFYKDHAEAARLIEKCLDVLTTKEK